MFKVAGKVIDQYDDPKFFEDEEMLKVAAQAGVLPEELDKLPDSDFALKIAGRTKLHRYYPIRNKIATMISLWGFERISPSLPEDVAVNAATHLKEACERFDIDHPIRKLAADSVDPVLDHRLIRTDTKLSREALVLDLNHKVAAYLEEFDSYEPRDRVTLASELKLLADTLGEKLADARVLDYVPTEGVGPLFHLAVNQRETKLAGDGKAAEITELRNLFTEEMDPRSCAEALTAFDKTAGLNTERDRLIDPFKAAFGGQDKYALCSPFATYDPWYYKLMSLAYNVDLLRDHFTQEFIDRFQRAPQQEYERADSAIQARIRDLVDRVVEDRVEGLRPGKEHTFDKKRYVDVPNRAAE